MRYDSRVTTIAGRELRKRLSDVLRRAEQGEQFLITLDRRPVAELGPHRTGRWVGRDPLRPLLAEPAIPTLLDDTRSGKGQNIGGRPEFAPDRGLCVDILPR